ncbi:ATP-dependent RNA helicase DEAH13-like isoform X3 [Cornus florida]|uniref:ATP-dependent RNA helicase DEAH13-like isoform X3 n=1 Tax=Cornus florida TaxID=4283 RepID=UPI00289D9DDA|nr:ATP-dependent RNA helicase DEAH13-like isoform X3 [Cornus florida]
MTSRSTSTGSSVKDKRKNSPGQRLDPGWEHGIEDGTSKKMKCRYCNVTHFGGIFGHKHHLADTHSNVEACPKVPIEVREQFIDILHARSEESQKKKRRLYDVDEGNDDCILQQSISKKQKGKELFMDSFVTKNSARQTTINKKFKEEERNEVCQIIARFFYTSAIPFNCVNNPIFPLMIKRIGEFGRGLKPPSYHEIRETFLKKEVQETLNVLKNFREEWVKTGCTIMLDGWSDRKGRSICNFLINSPSGSIFLSSQDTSDISKTTEMVFEMLDEIVEKVGEDNVVQVVTDNASNYKAAGHMLMEKRKRLFWTPCAAHCIDLMLEDFEKQIKMHRVTIAKARMIVSFIYSRAMLKTWMLKEFTNNKELIRPAVTRFATSYLTLQRLNELKGGLMTLFASRKWTSSRFAKLDEGKKIEGIALDNRNFWKNVDLCLRATLPLVKVLRLVDSDERPAMGFIYKAMDRAKEEIQKNFKNVKKCYEPIWKIINARWESQLHQPLHAAAYFLNPQFQYSPSFHSDAEVKIGLYNCLQRMVPDSSERVKIDCQMDAFKSARGLFGIQNAILTRNKKSPGPLFIELCNLEQMEMRLEVSEQSVGFNCEQNAWSLNGDSNAMILPGEKRIKKNGKNQGHELVETKKNPKLSKSQKRKLKKLEEEKEKACLLAKSIEALEKYKIRVDAYSLMWSSRNIGQVETVREKRRRAVQFSKVGLGIPHNDHSFKSRGAVSTFSETEPYADEIHSRQNHDDDNFFQPTIAAKEVLSHVPVSLGSFRESVCGSGLGANGGPDAAFPVREVANERDDTCMHDDVPNSSPTSCGHDGRKIIQPMDGSAQGSISINNMSNLADCPPLTVLTAPAVVHVSRPKEVENKRNDLPIVMMEQEIMEAIYENMSVIICGETGCGKTTQVPQFLYEAGFGSNQSSVQSGIIGVTQPRRVAVLATAKRVAFELGFCLGKEVGFQVRHDKRIGDNCSIKFMTDGILLREVQSDFLLKRYSIIILDEAHERSLNTDILIGMLSRIIQQRQIIYEEQRQKVLSGEKISSESKIFPLKLVLMSATLRVEDFVSGRRIFYDPPPVIEVPTRQYPVTIHFSKRTKDGDYIGQAYKKVMTIHKRLPAGGILVFVTGQREVEYLCKKLRKASKDMVENCSKGNEGNDVTVSSEGKNMDKDDMKDINEAFEMHGNLGHQQTDRFSSYDEDHGDLDEDESDFSYDSGSQSDIEVVDDENLLNQKTLEANGNLADVLGENGSLVSLKAAFEALAGKTTMNPYSEGKEIVPVTPEGCLNQSKSSLGEEGGVSNGFCAGAMCVLPLYAMLPLSAQLHVFEKIKEGERLVVVATNVAETSLTIPGIKYVVDTGKEKVKNYNSSNGMETYEVQWISKASAAQRAGRAGRTGPGHCYRLYSSAAFSNTFPDFSSAEISKIPVDGVVLLMKSMGISKVSNFPFPTPPEPTALVEAEHCLKALEALDSKGRLTPLGKAMAQYPMSPRHSRMLLTVIQIMRKAKVSARADLVLGYAVAAAAALSLSNPFVMQFEGSNADTDCLEQNENSGIIDSKKILEKEEKSRKKKLKETAKVSRAKFSNLRSDALMIANALQCFELSGSPVEFCNDNALHVKTMEEMSKLRKQVLQLVFSQKIYGLQQEYSWTHGTMDDIDRAWRVSSDKYPLLLNEEDVLCQAICAGWADRIAKRTRAVSESSSGDRKVNAVRYQACVVKETVFLHRWSSLSRSAPEFLVYNELIHTKRPYMHGATSVKSDWLVKYAGPLCSFSAPLADPKPYYDPLTDQVFCWVVPTFGPHLWQLPLHSLPIKDDDHRVAVFALSLLEGHVLPCLRSTRKFMAASPGSILRPEALGHRRVGNLLSKLNTSLRTIDSCAMLGEVWNENPRELQSEIMDWFQEGFHDQFEELWAEMHHEVLLDPKERFPKRVKRGRRVK